MTEHTSRCRDLIPPMNTQAASQTPEAPQMYYCRPLGLHFQLRGFAKWLKVNDLDFTIWRTLLVRAQCKHRSPSVLSAYSCSKQREPQGASPLGASPRGRLLRRRMCVLSFTPLPIRLQMWDCCHDQSLKSIIRLTPTTELIKWCCHFKPIYHIFKCEENTLYLYTVCTTWPEEVPQK